MQVRREVETGSRTAPATVQVGGGPGPSEGPLADLLERFQEALASRYRIQRELGRGGMATVFLAEDLKHHRPVALKVLSPDLAAVLGPERFLREIETVGRLTHPHILPLYDSGNAGGFLYYVMPYVEGESLRDRLRREGQLPVEDALRIAREVAEALGYAHGQGKIHRDIKPENILLESGQAVVADFGLARAIERAGGETPSGAGVAIGTPAYMSPEQAAGAKALDGRSDLYSLGCVLYEMLAGQPPFGGPVESLVYQHLSVPPRPVTELRPAVGPAVRELLARALAKTPADRFANTVELARALAHAGEVEARAAPGGPIGLPPEVGRSRPRTPRGRRIALVSALAAVAAAAVWLGRDPLMRRSARPGVPPPAHKEWILVAEFEGPPDDSTLATAARSLVSASLDQSEWVATVPPDQILLALEQAGKPAHTRVSAGVARELAYRTTVRAVLDGDIARLGDRFTVTLRVTDVEEDTPLVALTDVARSEDDLIPVLTRLGGRVRQLLGERPGAIRTTRGGEWPVATPSFEAYRRWAEGMRVFNERDFAGARRQFREALALDPDFGVAWGSLGMAYIGLGKPDSALLAMEEASRRPESLTPAYRLYNEGRIAWLRGDARSALETFERVEHLYPRSVEAGFVRNNAALILEAQGRLEEALQAIDRRSASSPLVPGSTNDMVRARFLAALGRLDEARAAAQPLYGAARRWAELNLALAAGNWERADSLAMAYERAPSAGVGTLIQSALARAQVAAVRGEVSVAETHLRRAERLQHERGSPAMATKTPRDRVLLALVSGRAVPRPEPWLERDTTTSALITRAYMAAASGEAAPARRLLARLRARATIRLGAHGAAPEFIEAWIAARAGRWSDVVTLLAQPAREGSDRGLGGSDPVRDRIGAPAERWLVALAYDRLGQPDSAVASYRRMLGPEWPESSLIGLVHAFVHQRLVLLYARMGRMEDAGRHLAILERDVTRPDPDVRRLLDEARAAVHGARGMAGPERPITWEPPPARPVAGSAGGR